MADLKKHNGPHQRQGFVAAISSGTKGKNETN